MDARDFANLQQELQSGKFARRLRVRMAEDMLTTREVAACLDLSHGTVSRVARGHFPEAVTYLKLAAWLAQSPAPVDIGKG